MTTVSLVEDDTSFSLLLTRALSRSKSIEIISVHPNAEEALRALPRRKPDVVLMDIKLPGMNGIECLRQSRNLSPALLCHVLMLTEYDDSDLVFEALKAGASGYLLKDRTSVRELSTAIKIVCSGGAVMSPNIARKVIVHFQSHASCGLEALSTREMEVLAHLADGLMYKQIAGMLYIAENMVRRHVSAIYSKLHVQCRAHAARHYFNRPAQ